MKGLLRKVGAVVVLSEMHKWRVLGKVRHRQARFEKRALVLHTILEPKVDRLLPPLGSTAACVLLLVSAPSFEAV